MKFLGLVCRDIFTRHIFVKYNSSPLLNYTSLKIMYDKNSIPK